MHGVMLHTLFIDSRLYVCLMSRWPCGVESVVIKYSHLSVTVAVRLRHWLATTHSNYFEFSFWPCGKVVMQRSHLLNIPPPPDGIL